VAIEEHDPKAARKAMRAHLKQVLEDSSASAKSGSHLNSQGNPHVKPNS
jgi:DNA-binding GntR family transcriptional regulator